MKPRTFTEPEVKDALDSQLKFVQGWTKAFVNIAGWAEYNRGFRHGLLWGALFPILLPIAGVMLWWQKRRAK